VVVERVRVSPERWRTKMRYELTNAKDRAVTVTLIQGGVPWWWTDTRITDQNLNSERRDADTAVWQVPVPANGTATVTATFDTRI
jgi:hypothetical protein